MDRESFTEEREWTGGRIYKWSRVLGTPPRPRYTQPQSLGRAEQQEVVFRTPWRTCQLANKPENFREAPGSETLSLFQLCFPQNVPAEAGRVLAHSTTFLGSRR